MLSVRQPTTQQILDFPRIDGIPAPCYSPRLATELAASERNLVSAYLSVLSQIFARIGACANNISVELSVDPDEATRDVVVTSRFDVDATTALSY